MTTRPDKERTVSDLPNLPELDIAATDTLMERLTETTTPQRLEVRVYMSVMVSRNGSTLQEFITRAEHRCETDETYAGLPLAVDMAVTGAYDESRRAATTMQDNLAARHQ